MNISLFNKYEKEQPYTKGEQLVCYAYDKTTNDYVVCSTLDGDYYDYYY